MKEKATYVVVICVIATAIVAGMIYVIATGDDENEKKEPEIRPPTFIPDENTSIVIEDLSLESHNLSVKISGDLQIEEDEGYDVRFYTMVSECYKHEWTNISLNQHTSPIEISNETPSGRYGFGRVYENITQVPDGYHKVYFYLILEDTTGIKTGAEQSIGIESVLGRPRSWKVVDTWP